MMIYLIGLQDWGSLCTWYLSQKTEWIASIKLKAGVIAVVITLLVIQMG